ncbi:outer membrane lipoprotein-sorting protein [Candidatus Acetothermia bacterium]|nr:outer membrane lipoprotein-sorting protein [Candidatus Acetothermia bacterium]
MMKKTFARMTLLLVGLFAISGLASAQDSPSASDILKHVSDTLYPSLFVGKVKLDNLRPSEDPTTRELQIWRKGSDKVLMEVLSQGTEKGQKVLRNGDQILILFPDICQVLGLDPTQPLFGTLFNVGDVARLDLVADYDPAIFGTEDIDGKPAYILDLKAKVEKATYAEIQMWVRKADLIPLKAGYYGDSGKLLNHVVYEDVIELAGAMRPSKIVITSEIDAGATTLTIEEMTIPADLPDDMFTEEALLKSCQSQYGS